jgi:VanZ family protein
MNFSSAMSLWLPVGIWAGLIFYLSSIPTLHSGFSLLDFVLRKCAHVTEFAIFTTLLMRALRGTKHAWPWRRSAIVAGVFALLYAMSDEFHQSFVPGRGPSPIDVMIDGVGILLAIYVLKRIRAYA